MPFVFHDGILYISTVFVRKPCPSPLPNLKANKVVRVLRLRIKDKHAAALNKMAFWVNQVWNYCNDLSYKVWQRERRFLSGDDFAPYTKGASKAGIDLHSQTIQAVSEEYALRRKQFRKVRLNWRVSAGARRSLGWIPFKASALRYRNGQVFFAGIDKPLSRWDSCGLGKYDLGPGSLSQDARGRWYLNVSVKVVRAECCASAAAGDIGIDLGLKDFATCSDGQVIEARRIYRGAEQALATAQRANQKRQIKRIHARIANRRKEFHHQLSRRLVDHHAAIFVGNVNAASLARTIMPSPCSTPGGPRSEPCSGINAIAQACGLKKSTKAIPPKTVPHAVRAAARKGCKSLE